MASVLALAEKDLHELRTYTSPPAAIETVLSAVCVILGFATDWPSAMALMHNSERSLFSRIERFDVTCMRPAQAAQLAQIVRSPDAQPDRARTVSEAAHSLALWVQAVHAHVGNVSTRAEQHRHAEELQTRQGVKEVGCTDTVHYEILHCVHLITSMCI